MFFFITLFVTNQLAWLKPPVTPHKVNFLFVSASLGAVAGLGRKLLTIVFLAKCQHPGGGEEGLQKHDGGEEERGRRWGMKGGGGKEEEVKGMRKKKRQICCSQSKLSSSSSSVQGSGINKQENNRLKQRRLEDCIQTDEDSACPHTSPSSSCFCLTCSFCLNTRAQSTPID